MKKRFDNGALRLQRSTKIQDIALHDGYFKDHFFFFAIEDAVFDGIEISRDVVEARETGAKEHIENVVHQMSGRFAHIETLLSNGFFERLEKISNLEDVILVPGDEVRIGEDDVHFAGIRGSILGIEKRNVDGKKEAILESDGFGLIGRRRELFDGDRMDIEIFLKMENILRSGIRHIEPRDISKGETFHWRGY